MYTWLSINIHGYGIKKKKTLAIRDGFFRSRKRRSCIKNFRVKLVRTYNVHQDKSLSVTSKFIGLASNDKIRSFKSINLV